MSRLFRRAPVLSALFLLFSQAGTVNAVLPLPTYPQCGSVANQDPANCPNDFGEPWEYINYIKDDYAEQVRSQELELGSGIALDKAFSLETGRYDVTIAQLDSGIEWDEGNLLRKWKLNTGELPLPQKADGSTSTTYDANGDGLVNIDDYANDARVKLDAGQDIADTILDPSDLIYTFSNGVDTDGNGYIDDICGWDFFWNDNDPFDDAQSQGYSHGTIQARRAAAEGGDGGSIGSCPNCSIMMLRIGDSFIAEATAYSQAVLYAVDMGAKVVQIEIGGLNISSLTEDAFEYAWNNGVTIVASAADETSIHANTPAVLHHAIVVHPMTFDGDEEASATSFQLFNNCSDYGGRPTMVVSHDGCSSEATAVMSGVAGLLQSAGKRKNLNLTANEVYQLFIGSTDDVWNPEAYYGSQKRWYPSKEGFDRYFGYGRVNAYRAISRVENGEIPPEADLIAPRWFEVLDPSRTPTFTVTGLAAAKRASSYTYKVEYAPGLDPEPDTFSAIYTSPTLTSATNGTLATWNLSAIPIDKLDPSADVPGFTRTDDNVSRMDKINTHTVTLRVRVTDNFGRTGEMRKTIYLRSDPDSLPGFPIYLGASLEASTRLVDMDGDGKAEIIQPAADGYVYVLRQDGTNFPGWPVRTGRMRALDPNLPNNHVNQKAFKSGAVSVDRGQNIMGAAAVGDLQGDGAMDVVVASYDGEVYAWSADGDLLPGFPVSLDYSVANQQTAGEFNLVEDGFFSGPALGDLDGDGNLDIVAAGMDQQVYAWNYLGEALPGWPVLVAYPGRTLVDTFGARAVYPVAIGDVNADGMLDVVVPTAEFVDFIASPTYLIHGDGNLHEGGPFHDGWPILTHGLYTNMLPFIGSGTTSAPSLADIDGDGKLEVAVHSVAALSGDRVGMIFDWKGDVFSAGDSLRRQYGEGSNVKDGAIFPLLTTGAFGDLDRDGDLDYSVGVAGLNYAFNLLDNSQITDYTFSTAAWDAASGRMLSGFPQQVADMQFIMHQIIADVDGDLLPETISSSGAFTVTAFNHEGVQPAGWPKFTGQWAIATPAAGDINGDGYLDLVQATRSGYLYAWKTGGKSISAGGLAEWPSYRHDPHNTGNYQYDLRQFERSTSSLAPEALTPPQTNPPVHASGGRELLPGGERR